MSDAMNPATPAEPPIEVQYEGKEVLSLDFSNPGEVELTVQIDGFDMPVVIKLKPGSTEDKVRQVAADLQPEIAAGKVTPAEAAITLLAQFSASSFGL